MCKQANDLSILCDIQIGLIIFTAGENNVLTWPSLAQAQDRVKKYLASIKNQMQQKLVQHDNYFQLIVNDQENYVNEIEKIAEEKEMESLFNQLV